MDATIYVFLGTAILSFLGLRLYRRYGRYVRLTNKIAGPSIWEYVTVHAKHLMSDDMIIHLWRMCDLYHWKPWGLWTPYGFVTFVSDGDSVSEIYKNKHTTDKPQLFYDGVTGYVGEGLVAMNGSNYRRHRKTVNPAFRKNLLENHIPRLHKESLIAVNRIRELAAGGDSVDVRSIVDDYTGAASISVFSSGTIPYSDTRHTFELIKAAMTLVHMRTASPLYYWFVLRLKKSTRDLYAAIWGALDEARRVLLQEKRNAVTRLNENKQPENISEFAVVGEGFSDDEYVSESLTLLTAAVETVTLAENVCLKLLALHQDVQERAHEELESLFGSSDRPVQPEDITRMVYLEVVLKETLRMFPAGPMIGRKVREETRISGVTLPKDSDVFIDIVALHRNPNHFKDPLKFDPNRFLPNNSEERHPFCYIPFSYGVRNCPGQLQAYFVMKVLLCNILRNFRILPGEKLKSFDDIKIRMHFALDLAESSLRFVSRKEQSINAM